MSCLAITGDVSIHHGNRVVVQAGTSHLGRCSSNERGPLTDEQLAEASGMPPPT